MLLMDIKGTCLYYILHIDTNLGFNYLLKIKLVIHLLDTDK